MIVSGKKVLSDMIFSDDRVMDMFISQGQKLISFSLSGVSTYVDGVRRNFGEGSISIKGYDKIIITSYDSSTKTEALMSDIEYEKLKEICEVDVFENSIIVKGFSLTYKWIEFSIQGGEVTGEFPDEM